MLLEVSCSDLTSSSINIMPTGAVKKCVRGSHTEEQLNFVKVFLTQTKLTHIGKLFFLWIHSGFFSFFSMGKKESKIDAVVILRAEGDIHKDEKRSN